MTKDLLDRRAGTPRRSMSGRASWPAGRSASGTSRARTHRPRLAASRQTTLRLMTRPSTCPRYQPAKGTPWFSERSLHRNAERGCRVPPRRPRQHRSTLPRTGRDPGALPSGPARLDRGGRRPRRAGRPDRGADWNDPEVQSPTKGAGARGAALTARVASMTTDELVTVPLIREALRQLLVASRLYLDGQRAQATSPLCARLSESVLTRLGGGTRFVPKWEGLHRSGKGPRRLSPLDGAEPADAAVRAVRAGKYRADLGTP
jgi:hypothetical protein